MRANYTAPLFALLTLTTALPNLEARQAATTSTMPSAAGPTSTVTLDPTTLTGTTSITTIPTSSMSMFPTGSASDDSEPTMTMTEPCPDETMGAGPYGAGSNMTAPVPTTYHCPGLEVCHPEGGAAPPMGGNGVAPATPAPVAPYTGGAAQVGAGMGAVMLGLVGAWVL
jgi:hypothetical protein